MKIEYTDTDGDRVARIVCPANTTDVRFVPDGMFIVLNTLGLRQLSTSHNIGFQTMFRK